MSLALGLGLGVCITEPIWTPLRIPNTLATWDPAIGFTPGSWTDASGNGHTATQGTAGDQGSLVANALNGQPGILFGPGQQMTHTLTQAAPSTILCVAKTTAAVGYHCIIDTDGLFLMPQNPNGNWGMYLDALAEAGSALTSFSVVSAQISSPTSVTFRKNGVQSVATTGVSYYVSGANVLGGSGSGGQDLDGTLCYLSVIGRVVTAEEIAQWEAYALIRWGT